MGTETGEDRQRPAKVALHWQEAAQGRSVPPNCSKEDLDTLNTQTTTSGAETLDEAATVIPSPTCRNLHPCLEDLEKETSHVFSKEAIALAVSGDGGLGDGLTAEHDEDGSLCQLDTAEDSAGTSDEPIIDVSPAQGRYCGLHSPPWNSQFGRQPTRSNHVMNSSGATDIPHRSRRKVRHKPETASVDAQVRPSAVTGFDPLLDIPRQGPKNRKSRAKKARDLENWLARCRRYGPKTNSTEDDLSSRAGSLLLSDQRDVSSCFSSVAPTDSAYADFLSALKDFTQSPEAELRPKSFTFPFVPATAGCVGQERYHRKKLWYQSDMVHPESLLTASPKQSPSMSSAIALLRGKDSIDKKDSLTASPRDSPLIYSKNIVGFSPRPTFPTTHHGYPNAPSHKDFRSDEILEARGLCAND